MTKQTFYVLSGEIFSVQATDKQEALAKFYLSQGVATREQIARDFDVLESNLDELDVEFIEVATQIVE